MQRAAVVRGWQRAAASAAPLAAASTAAAVAAAVPFVAKRAFSVLRTAATLPLAFPAAAPRAAAAAAAPAPARALHTSRAALGLEEFFLRQQPGPTGRSWRVTDLRSKGWHDLHRLWFVLLKERNMLLTYRHQCRVSQERMDEEHRLRKVRQSMSAIKHVLGERYRAYKERTDQGWVERQARIRRFRSALRVRRALRKSPSPQAKGRWAVNGGLKPWQLSSRQKYARLVPRSPDTPAPEGQFPARMRAAKEGHGQAAEDLLAPKIKQEKEYV